MNYYCAREIADKEGKGTGKWRFTRTNDGITVAVGNCREHEHNSEEEACDCYRQYELDNHLRFSSQENRKEMCMICGNFTSNMAELGAGIGTIYILCDEHNNKEQISKLIEWGKPFAISSSY